MTSSRWVGGRRGSAADFGRQTALVSKDIFAFVQATQKNQETVNRYLNDPAFQSAAFQALVTRIYMEIRRETVSVP